MRGDRLGLGHIGSMQGGTERAGIEAGSGDGWGAIGERDAGVVDRRAGLERDADREPTSHWIGLGHGARGQHGQDGIHGAGSGGADGMRGDRLGLGHIGEVQGGAGRAGIKAGSGDGWGTIGERDAGVVDRRAGLERDADREPTSHWIGLGHGARGQHGQDGIHGPGSGGAHGMRGDRLGLGHIGEVQGGAGRAGIEAGSGDGWGAIGERDAGVVDRHLVFDQCISS